MERIGKLTLVLGGVASGKSALAERLVEGTGLRPVCLATAEAGDAEMAAKIAAHRAGRGPGWRTVEAPLDAAGAIRGLAAEEALLFDCASMWLSNHLLAGSLTEPLQAALLEALGAAPAPVVVVSNETGLGGIGADALTRRFQIALGALNRRLAARADCVLLVSAGLPLVLKGALPGAAR